MDLSRIKEAIAKVEDALLIYKALSEVGEALSIAGNLETTRMTLEPKVASLKAEVAELEGRKADLVKEWDLANEELAATRTGNKRTVADELEAARKKAEDEVQVYKGGLILALTDLSERKGATESEVADLVKKRDELVSVLAEKTTELEVAKAFLEETNARVADLKSQLASIAGKM